MSAIRLTFPPQSDPRSAMLNLTFPSRAARPYKLLCLGAHCDDIEIGCGGTVLKLLQDHDDVTVHWAILSSDSQREREARACADIFLEKAKTKTVAVKRFRNGFFPFHGSEIKEYFEELKQEF